MLPKDYCTTLSTSLMKLRFEGSSELMQWDKHQQSSRLKNVVSGLFRLVFLKGGMVATLSDDCFLVDTSRSSKTSQRILSSSPRDTISELSVETLVQSMSVMKLVLMEQRMWNISSF